MSDDHKVGATPVAGSVVVWLSLLAVAAHAQSTGRRPVGVTYKAGAWRVRRLLALGQSWGKRLFGKALIGLIGTRPILVGALRHDHPGKVVVDQGGVY